MNKMNIRQTLDYIDELERYFHYLNEYKDNTGCEFIGSDENIRKLNIKPDKTEYYALSVELPLNPDNISVEEGYLKDYQQYYRKIGWSYRRIENPNIKVNIPSKRFLYNIENVLQMVSYNITFYTKIAKRKIKERQEQCKNELKYLENLNDECDFLVKNY